MGYLTVRALEKAEKHHILKDRILVITKGVPQEYNKTKRNLLAVSAHRQNEVLRAFQSSPRMKGEHHA